jgi:uncharacterized membrane protein
MKQHDINEAEWRNPANWSWRGPLGMYGSRRDSRVLVPKANPGMGLTLNCAHRRINWALAAIAALPVIFLLAERTFAS